MRKKEVEQFFRENRVECNLSIKQPWILWRMNSSKLSLSDINNQMERLENYEDTNDSE